MRNDARGRIISELKLNLKDNNLYLIDSVNRRIAESEQKQLRELLSNKLETVERLERSSKTLTESLNDNFTSLNDMVYRNLDKINMRVEERLNEGFEKTNKTFVSILERLSRIDEAQKKIDSLSTNIVSLQDVLTDKKSRGIFGEVQLNHILSVVFGEKNDKIYEIQKKLGNSMIADAVLHIPEPVGICLLYTSGEDVKKHKGIIANPNCSTTIAVTAINELNKYSKIKRMIVTTFQAVSGAGVNGIRELDKQIKDISEGKEVEIKTFSYQIAYNAIPQIGSFDEMGYSQEEMKLQNEGRKILHNPDLKVNCTCVRVPIYRSHSESILSLIHILYYKIEVNEGDTTEPCLFR